MYCQILKWNNLNTPKMIGRSAASNDPLKIELELAN